MNAEKQKNPQDYEVPCIMVTMCQAEGVLCMSTESDTENYDVLPELIW